MLVIDQHVSQLEEQGDQLAAAAVHVADDVERALLVPEVGEQLLPDDDGVRDLLLAAQDVDLAEALLAQVPERSTQLVALALHHRVGEVAVRAGGVAVQTDPLREVHHHGHRQHIVSASERD